MEGVLTVLVAIIAVPIIFLLGGGSLWAAIWVLEKIESISKARQLRKESDTFIVKITNIVNREQ